MSAHIYQNDKSGSNGDRSTKAYPLDQRGKQLIWQICYDTPTLRLARAKFQDRLFDLPFEVSLGQSSKSIFLTDRMRENVIKREWMPWLRQMHDWITMYGIAPYYFEGLSLNRAVGRSNGKSTGGTADDRSNNGSNRSGSSTASANSKTFVPRCPDIFTGDIEIYLRDGKVQYQWRWSQQSGHKKAGDIDKTMHFMVKDPPTSAGDYTTTLSALVKDTQQLQLYRELERSVAFQTIVPRHVIEMHPSGSSIGGNNPLESAPLGSTDFFSLSPDLGGMGGGGGVGGRSGGSGGGTEVDPNRNLQSVAAYQRQIHANSQTRDVYAEIGLSQANQSYNARPTVRGPGSSYAADEFRNYLDNHPELGSLQEGTYPPNSTILKPFERYQRVAPPALPNMNYLEHVRRMDRMYAVSGAYPLSMLIDHGQTAANSYDAAQGFLISELRVWGKYWTEQLRDVFYRAYFPFFNKLSRDSAGTYRVRYGRPPSPEELLAIEDSFNIDIFFPKAPHMTFDQLKTYYAHRMIGEEEFRHYALLHVNMEGLPKPPEYEEAVQNLYRYDTEDAEDAETRATLATGDTAANERDDDTREQSGNARGTTRKNRSRQSAATKSPAKKKRRTTSKKSSE